VVSKTDPLMRKLMFPALLVVFLAACSKSPQEKAQAKIKEYVQNNSNDPSSYENIEYGKLDTLIEKADEERYVNYIADSVTLAFSEAMNDSITTILGTPMDDPDTDRKKAELVAERKAIDAMPNVKYYTMRDKCRGKNKLGVLTVNTYLYKFDTLMNVVSCSEVK